MSIGSHTFCLLSSEDECELFINTTASAKMIRAIYITYHIKITAASLSVILQNSVLVALLWRKPALLYWPTVLLYGRKKRVSCVFMY